MNRGLTGGRESVRMAQEDSAEWEPCSPGELRRLARRLGRRRQRRNFLRSAAVVAAVAATGGVALWLWADNPLEPSYGGITCSKVKARADAYRKGELSADVCDRIRQHLARCGPCCAFYRNLGLAAQAGKAGGQEPFWVSEGS